MKQKYKSPEAASPYIIIWFSIKEPKQFNRERKIFSASDACLRNYIKKKRLTSTYTSHCI